MSGGNIAAMVIVLIVIGGITASLVSYFRLQRHRADAAAMEGYRTLAGDVAEQQKALDGHMEELASRVWEIEKMLRSVG